MNLPPAVIVAVPMAAAIVVFFWSLDRIRKERIVQPQAAPAARATPRELVERLLRPAAENLSQRRSASGKPTLTEDLAPAGLRGHLRDLDAIVGQVHRAVQFLYAERGVSRVQCQIFQLQLTLNGRRRCRSGSRRFGRRLQSGARSGRQVI